MSRPHSLHFLFLALILMLTACGGGSGGSKNQLKTGILTVLGKALAGISYRSGSNTGITNQKGEFSFDDSKDVHFSLDSELLGTLAGKDISATQPTTLTTVVNSGANPSQLVKDLPDAYLPYVSEAVFIQSPTFLTLIDSQEERILTLDGKPVKGISYTSGSKSSTTDNYGFFEYEPGKNIAFSIAGKHIASVSPSDLPISIEQMVKNAENPAIRHIDKTLPLLNAENAKVINANFSLNQLEQALFKPEMLPTNRSLGINLETPQAEADGVYQPLAFADIFRVSRPFKENSCTEITYDRAGWPLDLPVGCANQGDKKYAMTRILQFMPAGAAPAGRYNVLYDGTGDVSFSGMASNKQHVASGHLTIDVAPLQANQWIHGLEVFITKTDETDPVRNIRIIMPGGICMGNPFERVETSTQCSDDNPYISFLEVLKHNRDAIIFNPDFLAFNKDFRVLRMMNFMEASPRRPESNTINPCPDADTYTSCLTRARSWSQIAKINDASWGGSFKTSVTERFGVPLEISVALANLLQAHPWYIIPFNASNDYIDEYASYLKVNLDSNLKAHIEYTNEIWNGSFWGSQYVLEMGKQEGLDDPVLPHRNAEYSARIRYYAKRAVEIFKRFESTFGGTEQLVRVIGSNHKSHATSREILSQEDTAENTDVLAVAPYFHGCWSRSRMVDDTEVAIAACSDTDVVPMVFTEATSLDDVFAVIESTYTPTASTTAKQGDTNSLSAITQLISNQVTVANEFGLQLYSYEGGQHLKVEYGDTELSDAKKSSLQDFFATANREPKMGEYYTTLLNEWKQRGGAQFVLFTSPQSYNRYGFFGIKEHINKPRDESPKYDASMTFQEETAGCWWSGC